MPSAPLRLFLAGDVMTGRGVDQILPHPSDPALHEPSVDDARVYVRLAEDTSGPVPRGVEPAYIWGDALAEWRRMAPAARIVNLETSITRSDDYDTCKLIHYRMHPANVACLVAAAVDTCVLANNHVLDYGRAGLVETLDVLGRAGIAVAGAGQSLDEAVQPAVRSLDGGTRLIIGACAHASSGVPDTWAALPTTPGVNLLPDLVPSTAAALARQVTAIKRKGDVAVMSIHWGDNWGFDVPDRHVAFAHRLVDEGVDLVFGHSSHHVRPIEIYRDRLILYGCGDFLDDYEGIGGYERYRDDLVLMLFPSVDPDSGRIVMLEATPMQIRRMCLNRASADDARWLCATLNRIDAPFGVTAALTERNTLTFEQR